MTTGLIRDTFGFTQKELAEEFDISFSTVKNWDARDCMPEYVFKLIINYLIAKEELKIEKARGRVDNYRKQVLFDAMLNTYDRKKNAVIDYIWKNIIKSMLITSIKGLLLRNITRTMSRNI